LVLDNSGKPMPALLGASGAFMAKSAKNVAVAKDFLKYIIQPNVVNQYLKTGLGRWLPPYPEVVKSDPFWLSEDPPRPAYATEPHRYRAQTHVRHQAPQLTQLAPRRRLGEREADLGHCGG